MSKHHPDCSVGNAKPCGAGLVLHGEAITEHWWSGWPGAYCLKCGAEDAMENCLAGCLCDCHDEFYAGLNAYMRQPKFCSECGAAWNNTISAWPRTCAVCQTTTWRNMRPVGVALIHSVDPTTKAPVVLLIRRAIEPGVGDLALISGFLEQQESGKMASWQDELVREVAEETSGVLVIEPNALTPLNAYPFAMSQSVEGVIQIFAHAFVPWVNLSTFVPNRETSEVLWVPVDEIQTTAFQTHDLAIKAWRRSQL